MRTKQGRKVTIAIAPPSIITTLAGSDRSARLKQPAQSSTIQAYPWADWAGTKTNFYSKLPAR